MLRGKGAVLGDLFGWAIEVNVIVWHLPATLAGIDKQGGDAAVDIDPAVTASRSGRSRERIKLFLMLHQVYRERLQHLTALVKREFAELGTARCACVLQYVCKVEAGAGDAGYRLTVYCIGQNVAVSITFDPLIEYQVSELCLHTDFNQICKKVYQIVRSARLKASESRMKVETACRRLISEYSSRPTLRSGSLITTVFGDAIAPRGGKVWLGSLIDAMSGFGISERLVRTSVFRLARDGWLQSEQIGRRSYYGLTDEGRERFDQATHRIYGAPTTNWDGQWCLLLLSSLDTAMRDRVRKECGWLGFGPMSANVLAHPAPDLTDLDITMQRLRVADDLVVLNGQTVRNEPGMRRLAHESWNLAGLDERYGEFVVMFRPLMHALQADARVADQTAFLARTLLIQEYRKILLRDPMLPAELLPSDWQGATAYQLCRNLYRALHTAADQYLTETMETANGPLPPPAPGFLARFGGLQAIRGRKVSNG